MPEYLELVWNANPTRQRICELASSSSGLFTLSVSKLKALALPLHSMAEQQSLATEATEIDQASATLLVEVNVALQRSSALRRAVLATAFSGRLTGSSSDHEVIEELAGV